MLEHKDEQRFVHFDFQHTPDQERGSLRERDEPQIKRGLVAEESANFRPRPAAPAFWLIVPEESTQLQALTLEPTNGERMLSVFSFEEEARMFLHLGDLESGWRVRESGPGELVSVLNGPCRCVGSVALDPLPEMVADGTAALVRVSRERFVRGCANRESFRVQKGHGYSIIWGVLRASQ